MTLRRCLPLVLLVSACASQTPVTPRGSGSAPRSNPTPGCRARAVVRVPRVAPLALPSECSLEGEGSLEGPLVVESAEAYAAHVRCPEGVTPPAVAFETSSLYLAHFTLTPAGTGVEVHDDGHVVTFARLERAPCPDDPMPMPMELPLAFVLPKGEARTFRVLPCTVEGRCDGR